MSDDGGEKTFAPSDKRKHDAAQKGDVDDEDESDGLLPALKEGETLRLVKLAKEQKVTQPPAQIFDNGHGIACHLSREQLLAMKPVITFKANGGGTAGTPPPSGGGARIVAGSAGSASAA